MGGYVGALVLYVVVIGLLIRRSFRRRSATDTTPAWKFSLKWVDQHRYVIVFGALVLPFLAWRLLRRDIGDLFSSIGIAVVSIIVTGGVIALGVMIVYAIFKHLRNVNVVTPVEKIPKLHPFIEDPEQVLSRWGKSPEERLKAIRKAFEEGTATIEVRSAYSFFDQLGTGGKARAYAGLHLSRSIASMSPRARTALMATEMLAAAGGDSKNYKIRRLGLLWGNGAGVIEGYTWYIHETDRKGIKDAKSMIDWYMGQWNVTEESVINGVLQAVNDPQASTPLLDSVAQELRGLLSGSGGGLPATAGTGGAWLRQQDIASSVFADRSPHAVQLGMLEDGTPLMFSGDESLITIAPPGSGKTQCNVFPTLLRWKGPALVLDISGDIYEKTSKWRSEHVGPVYKFSPLEPERSHRWSPLAFVRSGPDYIWEDARLLAELMIVPSGAKDPFWEDNARIFLTAAIATVVYTNPAENRPMHLVLDAMHGGEAWESMLTTLRLAVDVRAMPQHATSITAMEEKTRDSIRQTARSSLAAWSGARVARATAGSDWNPLELRSGGNATVYIVVQPHEVESYLSLLRVFIGQHIRMLFAGGAPKHGACPTLIMLDEMPRLRRMPPVDEALNIGRRFGLRLWMFAQSFGQLEEAYENAEGMVASCGVRIYMNPSSADGTAVQIAEQIGYRTGPMDGNRQLIIEPNVLAGNAFKDFQIVLGKGCKPAKVRKSMAWQDPEISGRFGEMPLTRAAIGGD